jgi:GT2 family glycosyltransferase
MNQRTDSGTLDISISVVSHSQIALVSALLNDLETRCKDTDFELILTLNTDEPLSFDLNSFSYPIELIKNQVPLGFALNHNQAFNHAAGRYFCVMNPDIRLLCDPFPSLLACYSDSTIGVAAPLVLSPNGTIEDSARSFPSPLKILCKAFGKCRTPDYAISDTPLHPDWVAGMFMLFSHPVFERLGGFDERYFLYYEDVDICARLRLAGYKILLCPQASIVHLAQRSSHHDFRFRRLHLRSMARFFLSPVYWRIQFCAPANKPTQSANQT